MTFNFADPALVKGVISQKFREKRFKFFTGLLDTFEPGEPLRILDIGGTASYWDKMNYKDRPNVHILLLNLEKGVTNRNNFVCVAGNAMDLSMFGDNEFDIVFSNSVIEHLFSKENQKRMAGEATRVGKYYYIQTPNLYFPVEPHWLFPLFQFLPFGVKVFLTKNLNLGYYTKTGTREAAINRINEVKLLTEADMKKLFPDGEIYRESFLGLTKSITLYRFPECGTVFFPE